MNLRPLDEAGSMGTMMPMPQDAKDQGKLVMWSSLGGTRIISGRLTLCFANSVAIPTSYPKFGRVWCTPPHMKYWWSDLGYYGQSVVEKALGSLPSLININPCRQLIEAATAFWDETKSVFRFGDVEMTPLLEEIGGYIENKMFPKEKRWQQTEVIVPKSVTLEEQATNWVSMAAD
ncbi:hypothetical protein FXO37_14061 [Capsicum annuum]|nr:hypothetical protein FXO37_14061 [Capsicum annuum]